MPTIETTREIYACDNGLAIENKLALFSRAQNGPEPLSKLREHFNPKAGDGVDAFGIKCPRGCKTLHGMFGFLNTSCA